MIASLTSQMSDNLLEAATALVIAALCVSSTAAATTIDLQDFAGLSNRCAPHVAIETLAAVARTESRFDFLTIHDNSSGQTYHPADRDNAIALGVELATVERHSIDLGLMQVNNATLSALGLSIPNAFDPCANLAAADRVLVDGYAAPGPGGDTQQALRETLSRYNTGDPVRGIENGYIGRVQSSAELVVPALRTQGDAALDKPAAPTGETSVTAQSLPPVPPSWDVYARARIGRREALGASPVPVLAIVPMDPPVSVAAAAPSALVGPMPAQRPSIEALNDVR